MAAWFTYGKYFKSSCFHKFMFSDFSCKLTMASLMWLIVFYLYCNPLQSSMCRQQSHLFFGSVWHSEIVNILDWFSWSVSHCQWHACTTGMGDIQCHQWIPLASSAINVSFSWFLMWILMRGLLGFSPPPFVLRQGLTIYVALAVLELSV